MNGGNDWKGRLVIPIALLVISMLANAYLGAKVTASSQDHEDLQTLKDEVRSELPVIRWRLGNIEDTLRELQADLKDHSEGR